MLSDVNGVSWRKMGVANDGLYELRCTAVSGSLALGQGLESTNGDDCEFFFQGDIDVRWQEWV